MENYVDQIQNDPSLKSSLAQNFVLFRRGWGPGNIFEFECLREFGTEFEKKT
jgi:hypothetical protein